LDSGIAASDADIAQGSVAEVHQLVPRMGATSPLAKMSFQLAPTRRAMRTEHRNAHGTSPILFTLTRCAAPGRFALVLSNPARLRRELVARASRAITHNEEVNERYGMHASLRRQAAASAPMKSRASRILGKLPERGFVG
jgi:hypothetical protein